ncbi:MAG: L-serine ammonia-lyase, iron-sulfur-dependent, subunit alpha [Bacteroidaceae bacterium]|nr:L-serine ammonia-lyase, iron-sulfur-dependent, subunit alpha [Bacteroidaceae bacterium]
MKKLTKLIFDDMRPALGVTEPGAIAYSISKAKKYSRGELQQIHLVLNSGMYKNAFTCGIPNSLYYGNEYAAALGYIAADADKELECLEGITPSDNIIAEGLVKDGKVKVEMGEVSSRIYILAEIISSDNKVAILIRDSHTNIVRISVDNNIIFKKENADQEYKESTVPYIHTVTFRKILNYVKTVDFSELTFIRKAYEINLELFEQSIKSRRTTFAHHLFKKNGETMLSDNEQVSASLLCNAAIEARVLGLSRPAMSITGSGAHGIIATLPLYASHRINGLSEEQLLRATALSYLVCMYIKEYSGRLSAFCGCAIAAGTGMACGLAYLKGANFKQMTLVIQNMASSITGMICDGGNHGCTMKGIVAVDAAYQSVALALDNIGIESIHGINGATPEATMRNIGLIASPGMVETEKVVVDIMKNKRPK